jgi:general stress protein CsbA
MLKSFNLKEYFNILILKDIFAMLTNMLVKTDMWHISIKINMMNFNHMKMIHLLTINCCNWLPCVDWVQMCLVFVLIVNSIKKTMKMTWFVVVYQPHLWLHTPHL